MLDTSSVSSPAMIQVLGGALGSALLSKKDAKSLRVLIKGTAKDKFNEDWNFARLIWTSKTTIVDDGGKNGQSFYKYCGYNTWRDYAKQEVGLDPKTADRYVKVYQKFGVDLRGIFNKKYITHITKMYRVIPLVNEENVNEIFESIKDVSAAEYDRIVGFDAQTAGTNRTIVSYQVSKSAKKTFKRAIDFGRNDFGDSNDGEIMHKIIKFYLDYREEVFE